MFVYTLDTGRLSLAASSDQAGIIWQRQPALGTHHITVPVDMSYAIVYEFMTIAANALRAGYHNVLAVFHSG